MTERIVDLVLDESKWLSLAMLLAIIAVFIRISRQGLSQRLRILEALNLFYGCMIGIMSFGHLLAVTVKASQGTLGGSLLILYALGLVLAIPSWWLAFRAGRFVNGSLVFFASGQSFEQLKGM